MYPDDTTNDIPYGYCHCGCGEKTKIANKTSAHHGKVKGEPMRYINGHNARKHFPTPEPKFCECGCGELTPIAKGHDAARGAVRGQHQRFIAGHAARLRPVRPIAERFWEKVDVRGPDDCWEWKAAHGQHGRGTFMVGSKRHGTQRQVPAHRFAYELEYGPIPNGMEACHKCDNPPCCNPRHIFAGTHKENMEDMAAKGRSSQGERDSQAKLTTDKVLEIRRLCASGMPQEKVGKLYGVTQGAVWLIVTRRRWKHVD
jgi:hypothetical protein